MDKQPLDVTLGAVRGSNRATVDPLLYATDTGSIFIYRPGGKRNRELVRAVSNFYYTGLISSGRPLLISLSKETASKIDKELRSEAWRAAKAFISQMVFNTELEAWFTFLIPLRSCNPIYN